MLTAEQVYFGIKELVERVQGGGNLDFTLVVSSRGKVVLTIPDVRETYRKKRYSDLLSFTADQTFCPVNAMEGVRKALAEYIETKDREAEEARRREIEKVCQPPCHCCAHCEHYRKIMAEEVSESCSSSVRPCFGTNQVRCLCQIQVGRAYYIVNVKYGYRHSFLVTRKPYKRDGGWWIDGNEKIVDKTYNTYHSLADFSVVPYPYEDGQWNQWNYIAFAEPELPHCHRHHCCCCHHHH